MEVRMVWRLFFRTASLAFCTDLSYRPTAIPIRMRMIVMTIINSMSVNPARGNPLRRFINDLQARICACTPNSNPPPDYQAEYLVTSSAVPVDLEYKSKTFFPPQLVQSGSSY